MNPREEPTQAIVATPAEPAAGGEAAAPIISLQGTSRVFEPEVGVFDLELTVPEGTILGLIGPSGSGKTTTVRLMLGLLVPDAGEVAVLGEVPSRFPAATREQIGYLPQHFVLYPQLTAEENLHFMASLYGMGPLARRGPVRDVLALVELTEARRRLADQLSGGMRRRLELACALVHGPRLLFADEPTAGVDPVLRQKFWEYFGQLRDGGATLVVTTQYVGEAAYCDVVGVLRAGRLVAVDTPAGLRRRALGGEVVRLLVAPGAVYRTAQVLQGLAGVRRIRIDPEQGGQLFVGVDEAASALPEIVQQLGEQPDIEVLEAGEYQPPFDDVFVALMRQLAGEAAAHD
jgi:ABC-2 type transport system ATP-binding protein